MICWIIQWSLTNLLWKKIFILWVHLHMLRRLLQLWNLLILLTPLIKEKIQSQHLPLLNPAAALVYRIPNDNSTNLPAAVEQSLLSTEPPEFNSGYQCFSFGLILIQILHIEVSSFEHFGDKCCWSWKKQPIYAPWKFWKFGWNEWSKSCSKVVSKSNLRRALLYIKITFARVKHVWSVCIEKRK